MFPEFFCASTEHQQVLCLSSIFLTTLVTCIISRTSKHDTKQMSSQSSIFRIHWPKMKTLHFISLNSYFVSIHVAVRFMHNYRNFVVDTDYAIFIQILGLFKRQRLKNAFLTLHVLRNRCFTNSFKTDKKTLQLSTDDKKMNYCYKTLAFSDGTSFKRSKKPNYWRAQGGVYGKWYRASFWLL